MTQGQLFNLDMDDATLKRGAEAKAAEEVAKAKAPSFIDRLREAYTANPTGQLAATGPKPVSAQDARDEADRLAAAKLVQSAVDPTSGLPNVPKPAPDLMGAITAPIQPPAGPLPAMAPASARMSGTGGSGSAGGPPPDVGPIRTAPQPLPEGPTGPPPGAAPVPAGPKEMTPEQELAAAKAETEARRNSPLTAIANILSGFSSHGDELSRGIQARIGQPMADLIQKREMVSKSQAEAEAKAKSAREAAQYDENSPMSQTATKLAMVQGLIKPGEKIAASMWPMLKEGASLQEAREQHASQIKDLGEQRRLTERGQNINLQMERERTAGELAKERLAKATSKTVPSGEAANIGGLDSASSMLDSLMKTRHDKTGGLSGIAQYLPGTDASQYKDAQEAAAQMIGQVMEGGKLTDSDFARYKNLLPTAGDSATRAQAKVDTIKRMLGAKRQGVVSALGTAGYDASGLARAAPPASSAPAVHPEAAQAMAWAKAHPGDPRAQAILQRVGGA